MEILDFHGLKNGNIKFQDFSEFFGTCGENPEKTHFSSSSNHIEDMQTLRVGCSKAEPKIFVT